MRTNDERRIVDGRPTVKMYRDHNRIISFAALFFSIWSICATKQKWSSFGYIQKSRETPTYDSRSSRKLNGDIKLVRFSYFSIEKNPTLESLSQFHLSLTISHSSSKKCKVILLIVEVQVIWNRTFDLRTLMLKSYHLGNWPAGWFDFKIINFTSRL